MAVLKHNRRHHHKHGKLRQDEGAAEGHYLFANVKKRNKTAHQCNGDKLNASLQISQLIAVG